MASLRMATIIRRVIGDMSGRKDSNLLAEDWVRHLVKARPLICGGLSQPFRRTVGAALRGRASWRYNYFRSLSQSTKGWPRSATYNLPREPVAVFTRHDEGLDHVRL